MVHHLLINIIAILLLVLLILHVPHGRKWNHLLLSILTKILIESLKLSYLGLLKKELVLLLKSLLLCISGTRSKIHIHVHIDVHANVLVVA